MLLGPPTAAERPYDRPVDPQRLLDGLDPAQRRAVLSEATPLAILAGAGSGKTRVLTRRIAHRSTSGAADARHVLALTFTRRAAAELDSRLRAFGLRDLPAAGTFHAVAYAQLRTRWATQPGGAPTLLDRKVRILGRILGSTTRMSPADLATEIEWARARLVSPDRYPIAAAQADRRTGVDPERVAEWYRRYEDEKRKRGLVDFDDLLERCAEAIEADPGFAAAQRWRFRHLFVDEYQDVNPLQERLLRAWLGDRTDLTVVGDPNQAIYGWNGADASYLREFSRHHPGGEVVALDRSYRSTPQILAVAASALGDAGFGGAISAVRADGPAPTVTGYRTDVDEANGIARAVHDLHAPGRPWGAQAVLVRTNAQTALLEAAFRRAAIPHRVRGASSLLDGPDVRDLLRSFERSTDPLATTIADLGAELRTERTRLERELGLDLDGDDPTGATGGGLGDATAAERRLASLEQIVRLGRDLLVVDPHARTEAFRGWLTSTLQDEGDGGRDAVSIVTFHAAKGLEWPVVHVAGLEAGYVPISHARTAEARAEERRLLYVALTRAQDELRCTWAAERTFGIQAVERRPSPHLAAIGASIAADAAERTGPADGREALAESREVLAHHDRAPAVVHDLAADHELREALYAWREDQARKGAVRPTVVLSDKAVEALVRSRPASSDDLAALADIGPSARSRHGARLLAIVAGAADATPDPGAR